MRWAEAVRAYKRALIRHALAVSGGRKGQAARLLGLERAYFARLRRELKP